MPGLGEDITEDEKHKSAYLQILPKCDVAVWILKADVRTMSQVQIYLRDIVGKAMSGFDRVVIGLNQVDKIQPGIWNNQANITSKEQEESIDLRRKDISKKIQLICNIPDDRIIPYSAKYRYHLESLFWGMMDACPDKRAWVLHNRKALAEFTDLVDPDLLKKAKVVDNPSNGGVA